MHDFYFNFFHFFSADAKPVQEIIGSFKALEYNAVSLLFFFFCFFLTIIQCMYILQCNTKRITWHRSMVWGRQGWIHRHESKIWKHFPGVKWTFLLLLSTSIFKKTQYKNWQKPTETTDPHIKIYILLQTVVPMLSDRSHSDDLQKDNQL